MRCRAFVRAGGRAVLAGGPFNSSVLRTLLGTSNVPVLSPVGVTSAHAVGSAPEVAGVSVVDADPSGGAWDQAGTATPILRGDGASLALVADVGAGRVVLLASASPLRNEFLGDADNALFALDLAGGPGRAVAFDEYAHGFGQGGLGALPAHWKWAFLVVGVAVVVWMWSAIRRFGPPERPERALAPARVAYVEGLATVLAATDVRRLGEALAPVQRAARASLCRRIGVPDDTADAVIAGAARRPVSTKAWSMPPWRHRPTPTARWPPDGHTPGSKRSGGPTDDGLATTRAARPRRGSAMAELRGRVSVEVAKVVVGQQPLVDATLAAMAVGGHLLLEGPPGVAKTLLATAVARACGLDVRRVQFTPDLLPTDLTGTLILRGSELVFRHGPGVHQPAAWPTRSTGRLPRPRPPSSRPCRKPR